MVRLFKRYFLSVRKFAKKFSGSSFESCLLDIKFLINFFADLKLSLGLLEYFNLLSSVCNTDIA